MHETYCSRERLGMPEPLANDVVRHQTIPKKPGLRTGGILAQQMQISAARPVRAKDRLARTAAVRNVVRLADRHHSTNSAHATEVRKVGQESQTQ